MIFADDKIEGENIGGEGGGGPTDLSFTGTLPALHSLDQKQGFSIGQPHRSSCATNRDRARLRWVGPNVTLACHG